MNILKYMVLWGLSIATTQLSRGQIYATAAGVNSANYETSVYGAIANTNCTVSAGGSPSASVPALPASLSANQSVVWSYADGTWGGNFYGGGAGAYALKNMSFRNVIRGSNNNGGINSGIQTITQVANISYVGVVILGPNIGGGVSGATNFTWTISTSNGGVYATGSGETTQVVPVNGTFVSVQVTASNANELGSVMVGLGI